jgi:hemerythrin
MEEGWMAATGFAPENCHSRQHAMVLDVLRQVRAHTADAGDLAPLRALMPELAQWFPSHAEMMDAALVFHMQQVGFDPASGSCASARENAELITSCGSGGCS